MGWIIGAPSKRRIKGRLSVTSTAFPTSNAANVAVKKPLNSTPCSSRIKRLVHKIRLKPTKKKIVGGSACFTCSSTNRRPGVGMALAQAEQTRAGSYGTPTDDWSHFLAFRIGSMICQRTRKRHEDDQSDDRNNNYHYDNFWVTEALARDHERSGNVALA